MTTSGNTLSWYSTLCGCHLIKQAFCSKTATQVTYYSSINNVVKVSGWSIAKFLRHHNGNQVCRYPLANKATNRMKYNKLVAILPRLVKVKQRRTERKSVVIYLSLGCDLLLFYHGITLFHSSEQLQICCPLFCKLLVKGMCTFVLTAFINPENLNAMYVQDLAQNCSVKFGNKNK